MTSHEWRYKRRDETGKIVQEDWRPRPEGSTMYQLYDVAQVTHGDDKTAPFGIESRPVPAASI